jgi:hypothetical protein
MVEGDDLVGEGAVAASDCFWEGGGLSLEDGELPGSAQTNI